MGEIADSIISGEFDYINGEYIGEQVGYPRTRCQKRKHKVYPSFRMKLSDETRSITDMCKSLGLNDNEKAGRMSSFLRQKGYKEMPKMNKQYKIIYHKYKDEFKQFVKDWINEKDKV